MCDAALAGRAAEEDAMQPVTEEPSPRLHRILSSLGLTPSPSILSCEAAVSMDVEVFGERTEEVREWAFHSLAASTAWSRPQQQSTAPGPPAALDAQTALVVSVPAALDAQTALIVTAPVVGPPRTASAASSTALCVPVSSAVLRCESVAVPPSPRAAASAATAACSASKVAVLGGEEDDIARAVNEFLHVVPRELLLSGRSALSDDDRVAARKRHLLTCGASSVRAGTAFVRAWIQFCERRALPQFGVPVDADLMQVFLADVDASARQRAAGKVGKRTGASVQHATACAARWTADHAGLPFDVAKTAIVRKTSAPSREREPSWSEMWEPSVLPHLLRVATAPQQRALIRAMAASVYLVCAASMRLIDGQRSAPPVLDDHNVFHGVAVLSKGRRRSAMAPKPWSVPCVSPDGELSDGDVAAGLRSALASLPPLCCSMFPRLLDAAGKEVALERATTACTMNRATDAYLETTVTYLLTLPPLSLSRSDARRMASRKHGPRHTIPEVARVMGLSVPARNELGLWSDTKSRLRTMPNRYSRDAERLLSRVLRGMVLRHIRSRMSVFRRLTLQQLVASPAEMSAAHEASQAALAGASDVQLLDSHARGGSA